MWSKKYGSMFRSRPAVMKLVVHTQHEGAKQRSCVKVLPCCYRPDRYKHRSSSSSSFTFINQLLICCLLLVSPRIGATKTMRSNATREDKSGAKTTRQLPTCVRFVIPASRLIVVSCSVVTLSCFTRVLVCVLVRCGAVRSSAAAQEDRNNPTWHCEGSVARLFSFIF